MEVENIWFCTQKKKKKKKKNIVMGNVEE